MGFTASMDDFDDERFSRGVLLPAPAARHARRTGPEMEGDGPRRVEGRREEQLLGPPGHPSAVRVRGLGPEEKGRIRDELQLLAALEVAGLGAVPAVLEIEDDGYVRETAPAVRRQGGRRVAETVTPPTEERLALARARESLDALVEELHGRGWVLGAPPGEGLGSRADGTVIVVDLGGLRREGGLAARQEDRRWVDSVLQDQDRTLRRRVHVEGPRAGDGAIALGDESPPETLRAQEKAPVPPVLRQMPDAAEPPPSPGPADEQQLPVPRRLRRRHDDRALHAPPAHATAPALATALSTLPGRAGAGVREVLHQPRLRRIAVLSGLAVLLCGAVVALGTWWAGERGAASADGATPAPVAAEVAPAPVPGIEDPWMLAADLAGARHAFLTGISEVPASAPDSESLAEDQRIRTAYEGITVHGGGPVVHSAELVDGSAAEDEVVLRAVTSTEEHELEAADGGITRVPASAPVTVLLTLRWDGSTWLIVDAERTGSAQETGQD